MTDVRSAAARTNALACLACGKCTPACPVAERVPRFSPRALIETSLYGETPAGRSMLSACLACGACETRCPSAVRFVDFVLHARAVLGADGVSPPAHGGVFRMLPVIQSRPRPERNGRNGHDWLGPGLRMADCGEVLYFVGCAPLFDAFFADLGVETRRAARAAVRLMNAVGIEPVILHDEVCCGHDRLFAGDANGFRALARQNVEAIRASGARTVVTSCAECARCLAVDYPAEFGSLPFATRHLSQWLTERLADHPLGFETLTSRVTYQDPCRLSRHLGETEAPRALLGRVPGLTIAEMSHSGVDARCCGTEGFERCGAVNKSLQNGRLQEAAATGAEVIVTSCPKCLVHLRCAQRDGAAEQASSRIEIRDLGDLLASTLPSSKEQSDVRE